MHKAFKNLLLDEVVAGVLFSAIVGTAFLGLAVYFSPVLPVDFAISHEFQERQTATLLSAMALVSFFGNFWIAIVTVLAVAGIFLLYNRSREAFFILLVFPADLLNYALKILINRPRPNGQVLTVLERFSDPSFPSGHVVHYVVFFGFLFAVMLKLKTIPRVVRIAVSSLSLALILLVAVSRISLGVHWATDTVAGYLVGFGLLFIMLYFYLRKQ